MRIKKYTAGSMREALLQIKNELGEEAIILKTRKLPKKVFSIGAREDVEVTAAVDETAAPEPAMPPLNLESTGVYARPRPVSNIIDPELPGAPEVKNWEPPRSDGPANGRDTKLPRRSEDRRDQIELLELRENIRELQDVVRGIVDKGSPSVQGEFTGGWAALYLRLIESEVQPVVAAEILKQVGATGSSLSGSQAQQQFISSLTSSLKVAGPLKLKKGGPLVVAFVGPTGGGKTTTLAKLAAHCCITKKKKVSIITADTYRIAAIEQIRMFADIIKVGLKVVFSTDEVADALRECVADDIVLVDTAGRSQRNVEHMDDLRLLIESLHADEVHLVLSATTKDGDLIDCIDRYRPLGVNRLIFTKLDETGHVGNLLNSIHRSDIPVAYFTTGQSVPDDIEVAQASRLLQRLLGGRAT